MRYTKEKSLKSRRPNEKASEMKGRIARGLLSVALVGVLTTIMPFRVNDTGEETFGLLCFAEITEFAKELHSEMEKVVLMDELPENWTYPLIQPKLIEKYLQVKIIL